MKKKYLSWSLIYIKKILISVFFSAISVPGFSQSSLYISAGTNVVVSGGTALVVDGFSLKPTADYTITGLNSATRDAVTVPASPTPYINRVYRFLSNLPSFSGDITFNYLDAELNGLSENLLNLNLYNGSSWTLYAPSARDNVNNFVTTTGLTNIVFNQATLAQIALVPVTITNVKAYQKNAGVQVEWRSEQEVNIDSYDAERSQTGVQFTSIGKITARNNTGGGVNYSLFDPSPESGLNYYRIKIIGQSGEIKYSLVVKVNIGKATGGISIYPNPVIGNSVGLQMNNMPAGIYIVSLTNTMGQRLAAKTISHSGGSAAEILELPKALTQGIYQLSVRGGGMYITEQVIKR